MDVFKYGSAFFAINEFHFSHYGNANTSDEMEAAQELVKQTLVDAKFEIKN